MFLHVSVILFTEGGWYPSMPCSRSPGGVSQHALQVSRPTPRKLRGLALGGGVLQAHTQGGKWRGLAWGGGGFQAHTQGGLQAHTWGGGTPACTEADPPPPDGYRCGRYASYWNVFLFRFSSSINKVNLMLYLISL